MSGARITPTSHYTGQVWVRAGLAPPEWGTLEGRALHTALRPVDLLSRSLGGPTLDGMLLARHLELDRRLHTLVRDGTTQIVELAAGLSPRGHRFVARYGDAVEYVETDLPAMAERKRALVGHRVEAVDALQPGALERVVETLDPARGLAMISEGLLNYLDRPAVESLWERIAAVLSGFAQGTYLSDLVVGQDTPGLAEAAAVTLLSGFVRGRVHVHYRRAADVRAALLAAGFTTADVAHPDNQTRRADATVVRILEAHR